MISETDDAHKEWLVRPRLRPVEVLPVRSADGREAVLLRDPCRLAPHPLYLSASAVAVLTLLDGRHELRDIQAELFRIYGELVELEAIKGLIKTLDERFFLDGEVFQGYLAQVTEDFIREAVRPALLAGQAYPADPEALSKEISGYFRPPKGPGSAVPEGEAVPLGLVAPHIDFARGGHCYAWAYSTLPATPVPDLVVILGTAHSPIHGFFSVCGKDFETPWGAIPGRRDLHQCFIAELGPEAAVDELVHRGEHSIEFQAVWLRHHYGGAAFPAILPILCGSFLTLIEEGHEPTTDRDYEHALGVLKRLLEESVRTGQRVVILASADLSHVGPQFGGRRLVTRDLAGEVRDYDLALLERAMAGDHAGFFQWAARSRDHTNVCGLASIYTLLRLLDGRPGKLLAYDQWIDENRQGLVSFAGLSFS
jgi:hypothetical protein